jgi:hypothetical protein
VPLGLGVGKIALEKTFGNKREALLWVLFYMISLHDLRGVRKKDVACML